MNSYEITFRYYDKMPDKIYLPAKNHAEAFSNAHRFINPYSNCCEIIPKRVSKAYMVERKAKYAMENWRVDINYLSKDYDDSALETSTPFNSLWRAERYYEELCEEDHRCVDDKTKPARIKLTHYMWKDGKTGESELIRANYEGAKV